MRSNFIRIALFALPFAAFAFAIDACAEEKGLIFAVDFEGSEKSAGLMDGDPASDDILEAVTAGGDPKGYGKAFPKDPPFPGDAGRARNIRVVDEGFSGRAISVDEGSVGPIYSLKGNLWPPSGTVSFWIRLENIPAFGRKPSIPLCSLGETNFLLAEAPDYASAGENRQAVQIRKGKQEWMTLFLPKPIEAGKWCHVAFGWNTSRMLLAVNGIPLRWYQSSPSELFSHSPGVCPPSHLVPGGINGAVSAFTLDRIKIYDRLLGDEDLAKESSLAKLPRPDRKPIEKAPPASGGRFATDATYSYPVKKIFFEFDASGLELPGGGKAVLKVNAADSDGKGVGTAEIPLEGKDRAAFFIPPAAAELAPGKYVVRAELMADGKAVMCSETPMEVRKYEWLGNRIGCSDKVPPPWTPVKVQGNTVSCWGRDYRFADNGFPEGVSSLQPEPTHGEEIKELLAAPVEIVVEKAGKRIPLEKKDFNISQAKDCEADVKAVWGNGDLSVIVDGVLEFDGFYKFKAGIRPVKPVAVDTVCLDIAVPDSIARLFYAIGGKANKYAWTGISLEDKADGLLWDSLSASKRHEIANKANLVSYLWLGDDDRGIAMMMDNSRSWQVDPRKATTELVRKDGKTLIRMFLKNLPGDLAEPIDAELSVQATPVRPRPPGGSFRKLEHAFTNRCFFFDRPLVFPGCFDEANNPKGNYGQGIAELRRQGRKWWRYLTLISDRIPLEDPSCSENADIMRSWNSHEYNGERIDFILYWIKQWIDKTGVGGLYWDFCGPYTTSNVLGGLAWEDKDGKVNPSYYGFGRREFMKRTRNLLLETQQPPCMEAHMSTTPTVGYIGLCDIWLDGEHQGFPPENMQEPDMVDRWFNKPGMDILRISSGAQWGATMKFNNYFGGNEPIYALLGQFNYDYGFLKINSDAPSFGIDRDDCIFVPYWDDRKFVELQEGAKDVLAAQWLRPGMMRTLISNMAADPKHLSLKILMDKAGLPKDSAVIDERTGESLPSNGGLVGPLRVDGHSYRALLCAPQGTFAPTAALPFPEGIAPESDRFDSLAKEWTFETAPIKKPPENFYRKDRLAAPSNGWLRISGSHSTHSLIRKKICLDKGSVELTIARQPAEGNQQKRNGMEPGLALYWDKDHWFRIRVTAKEIACDGRNGSTGINESEPGTNALNNVRFSLQGNTLDLCAEKSAGSGKWKTICSVTPPEDALSFDPEFWILIGCGKDGNNDFLCNSESASIHCLNETFYKNLIIRKEP